MRTDEKDISFKIIGPPLSLPGRHRRSSTPFKKKCGPSLVGSALPPRGLGVRRRLVNKDSWLAGCLLPFLLSALTGRFGTFPNLRG
jgi:hypothetical protein